MNKMVEDINIKREMFFTLERLGFLRLDPIGPGWRIRKVCI